MESLLSFWYTRDLSALCTTKNHVGIWSRIRLLLRSSRPTNKCICSTSSVFIKWTAFSLGVPSSPINKVSFKSQLPCFCSEFGIANSFKARFGDVLSSCLLACRIIVSSLHSWMKSRCREPRSLHTMITAWSIIIVMNLLWQAAWVLSLVLRIYKSKCEKDELLFVNFCHYPRFLLTLRCTRPLMSLCPSPSRLIPSFLCLCDSTFSYPLLLRGGSRRSRGRPCWLHLVPPLFRC